MADVKAVILTPGKALLTQALTGYKLFYPSRFDVAPNIGFIPSEGANIPNGPVVFSGNKNLIQARQMAVDTARFTLVIPEGEGPFQIGNIMMYAENDAGTVVPFAYIVLPFQYTKDISDPNLSNVPQNANVPIPGNRFVCNITIKHSITATSMSISIVTPTFSSLAFFDSMDRVPPPVLNPWTTFVSHDDERTNTPALLTRRNDDTYWGIPFWQNYRDPAFGTIDGGIIGDGYKARPEGYAWGNSYLTPNSKYSGTIGGSSYGTPNSDYNSTVGGLPYTS